MEITSGEYLLVHSSTIIQIEDRPIKIKLIDEVEGDFTFIFNFSSDTTEKGIKTVFTPLDKFTMQVDLKNFNHAQNGGNVSLVDVGTLKHKPLFINYRAFDLNGSGKTLLINFYTREEATNG